MATAMDDPARDETGVEEGDDEALDAALDMQLAASYEKHPLPQTAELAKGVREENDAVVQEPAASQLSFAFPGWKIDISRGTKRNIPSISRHTIEFQLPTSRKGKKVKSTDGEGPSTASLAWNDPSAPVEGCPIDSMDDELLAFIFKRLNVKDLCASMRTCKWWYQVARTEDVWEHIPLPVNIPGALPRYFLTGLYELLPGFAPPLGAEIMTFRWMEVRSAAVSTDLRLRFLVFRKGYEYVRSALTAWWDHGKPDGNHPPAVFRSLTQKLVINDWSLLYEAFGAAFSDRADHIAIIILTDIEKIRLLKNSGDREGVTEAKKDPDHNLVEMFSKLPSKTEGGLHNLGSQEEISWDEFEVQEIWVLVLVLWRRYKRWLMLVGSNCPELNHEVMAERARGNVLASTPTVYDKGIICFRFVAIDVKRVEFKTLRLQKDLAHVPIVMSQVLLKYGIRSVLQAMWLGLASAKRSGEASEMQLDLFRCADHLFQEASVLDDLTLPVPTRTQQKLRRCFRNHTLIKS